MLYLSEVHLAATTATIATFPQILRRKQFLPTTLQELHSLLLLIKWTILRLVVLRTLIRLAIFLWKVHLKRISLLWLMTFKTSIFSNLVFVNSRSRSIASKEFNNDVNAARRYIRTTVMVLFLSHVLVVRRPKSLTCLCLFGNEIGSLWWSPSDFEGEYFSSFSLFYYV